MFERGTGEIDVIRRRRLVFHIAGYDPISARDQHQRFRRQLSTFTKTWNVKAAACDLEGESTNPNWHATAEGSNWQVESVVELLTWNDIILATASGSRLLRLLRAIIAYTNLLCTGTLFRYAMANQRYFLFSIVPLAEAALLGIVSWCIALFVVDTFDWPPLATYVLTSAGAFGLFLLLLEWPGKRWRIYQALDDWILSLDYVYRRRPDIDARLDHFANRILSESTSGAADEIVIVGHSLGAIFALDAVARAARIDPNLGRHGRSVSIVTVGATIPKCTLHPAAHWLRERIKQVAERRQIFWVEYQSRADAISFYRFDPMALRRISEKEDRLDGRPLIRRVQIQDMLQPATFAKYKLRVLRLHYQFVMANDRRGIYDYFMMVCGPLPVRNWSSSRGGFLDFFCDTQSSIVRTFDTKNETVRTVAETVS